MQRIILSVALLISVSALADEVTIPGTQVSYIVDRDTSGNSSTVFLSTQKNPDNYAQLDCQSGHIVFYLKTVNNLLTQVDYDAEQFPKLVVQVDSNPAKAFSSVTLDPDDDDNHLRTLAVADEDDPVITKLFTSARQRVTVQVTRSDNKVYSYVFPVNGLAQALTKVNNCK